MQLSNGQNLEVGREGGRLGGSNHSTEFIEGDGHDWVQNNK